jgi:murein DD-endopeptidase MepM/ murein hydrolase activator NlpD
MWWFVACAEVERVPVARAPPAEDAVPRGALALRFPLVERELFEQLVGVDHDPDVYGEGAAGIQCTSYDGRAFPWCYDEHDGSDYLLLGGFDTMDAGSATIVAAAPGVVVETVDGNYDRCSATVEGVDCDGYPMVGNAVIVEHAGGWRTLYWHLMNGSVAVEPGETVACSDMLGLVGSSGYSSMPHLHFELESPDGATIDPYAGPYSQPETWWVDQGDAEGLPGGDCAE